MNNSFENKKSFRKKKYVSNFFFDESFVDALPKLNIRDDIAKIGLSQNRKYSIELK